MINIIESLSGRDQQLMYDVIPYITLLIAGADGNIDPKELEWSEKITEIRSFSSHHEWQPYYEKVSETLHDRIQELLAELPEDTAAQGKELTKRLSKLNDILPKLDPLDAKHFYDGLLSFAERIARADGGVLGWFSVSPSEAKVVGLPMINPVELP
jgi:hypothetical protein